MGYVLCFIAGGCMGVVLICLVVASKNNDYIVEDISNKGGEQDADRKCGSSQK